MPEKGLAVLREAWRRAGLADGRLAVVGTDAVAGPEQVRNSYAAADVLVIPSLATGISSSRGGSSPTKP